MAASKAQFASLLAKRMNCNVNTASQWIDAYSETLFEIFKNGEGVTIEGLGGFYLSRRSDSTAFKFNPSQKLKKILGWSSSYKKNV